jgi:guanylate kinase
MTRHKPRNRKDWETVAGILFIISAPSGSGKSTLVNALRSQVGGIDFSISWTTRQPRGSEQSGREYHFTTREEFERMVRDGEFLEHAEVFGNYYGTARRSLDEATAAGRDLLLDIDVQGARQVRTKIPDAVTIFVMPPNPKVLRTRLRNRSRAEGNVDENELERRSNEAKKEIENYRQYRYILVNDVLERAVAQLEAVVVVERLMRAGTPLDQRTRRDFEIAEACRKENSRERLRPILESFGINPDSEDPEPPLQYKLPGG